MFFVNKLQWLLNKISKLRFKRSLSQAECFAVKFKKYLVWTQSLIKISPITFLWNSGSLLRFTLNLYCFHFFIDEKIPSVLRESILNQVAAYIICFENVRTHNVRISIISDQSLIICLPRRRSSDRNFTNIKQRFEMHNHTPCCWLILILDCKSKNYSTTVRWRFFKKQNKHK